jgi:pimeloyl-ACP methyl ester carboxylesterase
MLPRFDPQARPIVRQASETATTQNISRWCGKPSRQPAASSAVRRTCSAARSARASEGRRHEPSAKWVALALVASLLAAACGATAHLPPTPAPSLAASPIAASTAPSATVAPPSAISWSDCGNSFQCGILDVPRDYGDPAGPIVRLALIRLPASDPAQRIGSLVVNPGGPGESGVDFVRQYATTLFPPELLARFDIVGFDPRGVGASSPIRCVQDLEHFMPADATADTPSDLANLLAGAKTFAMQCGARNGDLLPYLSTADVAADLEQIRAALGDARLTYMGFSYGSLIGEEYASRFPTRIRALVLDGVVDPSLDEAAFREAQAEAFEGALDRFLADCAANPSCAFYSAGRPGPAFDALMRQIDQHPLPTPQLVDRERLGPTQAWEAVTQALYLRAAWPILAEALAMARNGDGSLMLLLGDPLRGRNPDGSYSNLIDAYYAVTCLDWPAPRDPAAYSALAARFTTVAPRVGRLLAFNDVECAYWPTPPVRTPAPATAPGAPPIVLVGSTGDPATPYGWAQNVARQLGAADLITRVGEGHTGYAVSACVRTAVDAYLLRLVPPAAGLRCH